ncbi:MAG: hypothetical protein O3A53_13675, partial [Acidobacteria bacterium]|nr:hypothetical protein [Acidobacteriota bacterium]
PPPRELQVEWDSVATIIKVCIASPNDMAEERELAFQAATDLDRAFLHSGSPLRLQTFGWEQVLPGLHAGGPQAMIEEQLPWRDADYVVAIFGRYFGKPDSGNRTPTEREVRDAYANWQRCSKPQLLLYFSDYAYQLTSAEEGRQWTAVLAFREEFQQKAKTRSFADKLSFHKTISGDLLQLCL